jgi:hypothetical protein
MISANCNGARRALLRGRPPRLERPTISGQEEAPINRGSVNLRSGYVGGFPTSGRAAIVVSKDPSPAARGFRPMALVLPGRWGNIGGAHARQGKPP